MIQILLVDDHPSVGEGTKSMIEQENDMKATVLTSSMEALAVLKSQSFDVFRSNGGPSNLIPTILA
ncbi:response regulator [Desulfosporosinus shakirovi]|uniref:response regulator n=1 Tax=Desulfosporosinus shakirovi TaxID=2885154 RepID=UPI001E48B9D3|nr:response regulator [Desulfosporosinus sp. SRJS8]MCB8818204.1 response regulator [Desulfosporosinus sp. SRJS8]